MARRSQSAETRSLRHETGGHLLQRGAQVVGRPHPPEGLRPAERRAGVVRATATPASRISTRPTMRGYSTRQATLRCFDYKGWGTSEEPRSRLAPYGRVADVQAALTFLGRHPQVNPDRLGIYGTSYGGATVVWVGAVDPRVKCVVSVVGEEDTGDAGCERAPSGRVARSPRSREV